MSIEDIDYTQNDYNKLPSLLLNKKKIHKINKHNSFVKSSSMNKIDSYTSKRIFNKTGLGFNKRTIHKIKTTSVYSNNNNSSSTKTNDVTLENTLKNKINEIKKELENNENTFVYNQKIMQKKLDEKQSKINSLLQEIENIKKNSKIELDTLSENFEKKYLNIINNLTKENNLLKNKNKDLIERNKEFTENIMKNQKKIQNLTNELSIITEKYSDFFMKQENDIVKNDIRELIKELNDQLFEKQNEINSLNEELHLLNIENIKLKNITRDIICNRNETEIFFLDSLNDAKKDLYKIQKEKNKRGCFFPALKKKNEDGNKMKVDIRNLTPEMRENVLRNLFEKINQNYDQIKYHELEEIIATDFQEEGENKIESESEIE